MEKIVSWARTRPVAVATLLGALISLPSLGTGFFADDNSLIAVLEGRIPGLERHLDLYRLVDGSADEVYRLTERGPFPWFVDPHLKLAFFRPLGAALLWLDHALFGWHAALYHLHSILWYAALCGAAALLFRRLLSPGAALVASVLFALHDTHTLAAAWIANRHSTVAALFATLGILAHIRGREERRPWLAFASLALFAVALCAGEAAFGALSYLLAFELWAKHDALQTRLRALAPLVALASSYLLLYKHFGYGTFGSASYLDPASSPRAFFVAAPARFAGLVGAFLSGVPADFIVSHPTLLWVLALLGLLLAPLLALLLRRADPPDGGAAGWLALGALLALVPNLGGVPSSRLLLVPSLGGAAAVAVAIRHIAQARKVRPSMALHATFIALLVIEVFRLPVVFCAGEAKVAQLGAAFRRVAHEAELPATPDADIVIVAASDMAMSYFASTVLLAERNLLFRSWRPLSMAPSDHTITRTASDTLEIQVEGRGFVDGAFAQLFCDPHRAFRVGQAIALRKLTVRVLDERGGNPTRVSAQFDRSLDDPSLWLMAQEGGRLRHFAPPPVGQSRLLQHTPGPSEK